MREPCDIVLVDHPLSLQELAILVASPERRVRPLPNARLALEALCGRAPDLLLVDLHLPGAVALCDALRERPELARVPMISLGEEDDPAARRAAFARGALDHLTRPYLASEIRARVSVHLELARAGIDAAEPRTGALMVVDDEATNRRLLGEALERAGHRVSAHGSGTLAIEAAVRDEALGEPPEVILLDASMPEVDGFEVCRRLRAHDRLSRVPVIFTSGHTGRAVRDAAFEAGASDFACKPFDLKEIKVRVGVALALAHVRCAQSL
jgi:CheY-like chemotaxis protein